jgi:hypothetical protein
VTLAEQIVALHEAFAAGAIPHAFGGAIALAYATEDPRGTSDVDVNLFVTTDRAGAVLASLPEGASYSEDTTEAIARDGQVRIFWEQTPLDLFFDYAPIHEQAARHARRVPFAGIEIPVLGPVELAVFKAMFDRTRDWADIEAMLAAQRLDVTATREALAGLVAADDPRFARLDDAVARARG